ncbi:hypothetical protein J1N35_038412 [Gossypium stocksii]|uniref:CCHC-type domain-containing protein n=1 Tax=Gossypium stocksii TaxID=47602 RepID=A0A9D3ZMM7_9ROSI|nr:hypothetical protein J1N35_038412 [Gossypium stocksii]
MSGDFGAMEDGNELAVLEEELIHLSCGRLGHWVKDCSMILVGDRIKAEDDLPYLVDLKAESSIIGKKSLLFGSLKKTMR